MAVSAEQELVRSLLETVATALSLNAEVDVATDDEGVVHGTLQGDDLGLFIGRHGQTIDAVQHLAQRMVHAKTGELRRIVIDAEGYRARRQEALERQADDAADEALRFDRPVALDAMTAGERRLVHEYLRDREDVETHSEGDEPDRHLVVSPARS
jgi:spoIIIJ-associated protein